MTDTLKKIVCCMLLLALVGTAAGTGIIAAGFAVRNTGTTGGMSPETQACLSCFTSVEGYCRSLFDPNAPPEGLFYRMCWSWNRFPCIVGPCIGQCDEPEVYDYCHSM